MKETIRHRGVVEQIGATTCAVRILQQTACGGCAVKHLCKSSESKEKTVEARLDGATVSLGQTVVVEGSVGQGLKAVLLAYALPLVLMVVVLFGVTRLSNEDAGGLCALLFLGIYYGILYLFRNRLDRKFRFVVKVINAE